MEINEDHHSPLESNPRKEKTTNALQWWLIAIAWVIICIINFYSREILSALGSL